MNASFQKNPINTSTQPYSRRQFLKTLGAATTLGATTLGATATALPSKAGSKDFPPMRTITKGPLFHWFGYYDKLQFDPANRYVLSNQVNFEHREPRSLEVIRVGMIDTQDSDKWIELGDSRAWGWQQGCMLQWRPGSEHEVLWNDRQRDQFVCQLLDIKTGRRRTINSPLYTVSVDGRFGLSADFARIQIMRPGYGYVGLPDPHAGTLAPRDSGVFYVDLASGQSKLILSLDDVAKIPHRGQPLKDVWHYFNHLLISPDNQRFIALHRWRARHGETGRPSRGFTTRMITANLDGSDVFVLDPSGHTSHFIWRDAEHVCMWTRPDGKSPGFYLYRDRTREITPVGQDVMTRNGHNTYLPGTDAEWILCDTYPDKNRIQRPYLYHVPSGRLHWLGEFHLPKPYAGQWRCDTHPRSSNDGRQVCIDSPHLGTGRQLHLIDISGIVSG